MEYKVNSKELIKAVRKHKGKILGVLEYAEMYIVIEKKDFIETLMNQDRDWKYSVQANLMFIDIDRQF